MRGAVFVVTLGADSVFYQGDFQEERDGCSGWSLCDLQLASSSLLEEKKYRHTKAITEG